MSKRKLSVLKNGFILFLLIFSLSQGTGLYAWGWGSGGSSGGSSSGGASSGGEQGPSGPTGGSGGGGEQGPSGPTGGSGGGGEQGPSGPTGGSGGGGEQGPSGPTGGSGGGGEQGPSGPTGGESSGGNTGGGEQGSGGSAGGSQSGDSGGSSGEGVSGSGSGQSGEGAGGEQGSGDGQGGGEGGSGENAGNNDGGTTTTQSQTVTGAINAGETGGSLSGYSTDALKQAAQVAYDSDPNGAAYNNIVAEIKRREEAQELENLIAQKAAELTEEINKSDKEINDKVDTAINCIETEFLDSIKGDIEVVVDKYREVLENNLPDSVIPDGCSREEYINQLVDKREEDYTNYRLGEIKDNITQIKEAGDQMVEDARKEIYENSENYKELARLVEEYNEKYGTVPESVVGDPVKIAYGIFMTSEVDFEAASVGEDFKVIRTYRPIAKNGAGSFGRNWICSLDSRILRTTCASVSSSIENIEKHKQVFIESQGTINELIEKNSDSYKLFVNEENHDFFYMTELMERLNSEIEITDRYIAFLKRQEALKVKIDKYNQYVAYGDLAGGLNMDVFYLNYVDSEGVSYLCVYKDGAWHPMSDRAKQEFIIFNLTKSGELAAEQNLFFGYVVMYADGRQRFYNKFGVLEKDIDLKKNITQYYCDSDTQRINKVITPSGEVINITRNSQNFIESIKSYHGETVFKYSGNNLVSVTDQKNRKLSYSYDADGDLVRITNPYVTSIAYQRVNGKKKVVSVTGSDGLKETFDYSTGKDTVIYKKNNGKSYVYKFDGHGNVLSVKGEDGDDVSYSYNENGSVSSKTENGLTERYFYDAKNNIIKVEYSDGSYESKVYNYMNRLQDWTDRDGVKRSYYYDSAGNLTKVIFGSVILCEFSYNKYGDMDTYSEGDIVYQYSYDGYGRLVGVKKNVGSQQFNQTVKYDNLDRMTEFCDFDGKVYTIAYGDNFMSQTSATERFEDYYNDQGLVSKKVETDLLLKKTRVVEFEYNTSGLCTLMKVDSVPYKSFKYDKIGNMISAILWNWQYLKSPDLFKSYGYNVFYGVQNSYSYDSKGRISKFSQSFLLNKNGTSLTPPQFESTVTYKENSGSIEIRQQNGSYNPEIKIYNLQGNLIKEKKTNGFEAEYKWSPNGRLLSASDNKGSFVKCEYKSSGTSVYTTSEGVYTRRLDGQVVSFVDNLGRKQEYLYDSFGNLSEIKSPIGIAKYSYDFKGRLLSEKVYEKKSPTQLTYESSFSYNDRDRSCVSRKGGIVSKTTWNDLWGNTVKTVFAGETSLYSYDALNRCIQVVYGDKDTETFLYGIFNSPVMKKDIYGNVFQWDYTSFGVVTAFEENGLASLSNEFDKSGRMVKSVRGITSSKTLTYNSDGTIAKITDNDFKLRSYKRDTANNLIQVFDAYNKAKTYQTDSNGRLLKETDRLGNSTLLSYDKIGRLSSMVDFEGNRFTFEYDADSTSVMKKSSQGEKIYIKKNSLDKITGLSVGMENGTSISYEYDTLGRMIRVSDSEIDFSVEYSYDDRGNCLRKKSKAFDFIYSYDSRGNIAKVSDKNSNGSVTFEYDSRNRESKRSYSNGIVHRKSYNDFGQIKFESAKEPFGQEIEAKCYLYDKTGRKILEYDTKSGYARYYYDKDGRLIQTVFPYTDSYYEKAKKDAIQCGAYLKENISYSEWTTLDSASMLEVSKILSAEGIHTSVVSSQQSWVEYYDYNDNGSLIKVESPLGKIVYEYDAEDRLVCRRVASTNTGGIRYKWNKNGCLEKISSAYMQVEMSYGMHNRPVSMVSKNFETGETCKTTFTYDALGRRVSETINGTDTHRYFYDGLSCDIIADTPLYASNTAALNYSPVKVDLQQADDFRLPEESGYSAFGEYRTFEERSANSEYVQNVLLPFSEYSYEKRAYFNLFVNNQSVMKIMVDGRFPNSRQIETSIVDGGGKILFNFDGNGDCKTVSVYGIWGDDVTENVDASADTGYSFSVNRIKNPFLMYNIGFRDYIPGTGTFTSSDPQRTGENSYAYCATDPVNFYDVLGYAKQGMTSEQKAKYKGALMRFLLYIQHANDMGIPQSYDCADTAALVSSQCEKEAGKEHSDSKAVEEFKETFDSGKKEAARNKSNSDSYFAEDKGAADNARRTFVPDPTKTWEENLKDFGDAIDSGTVLVWQGPKTREGADIADPNINYRGERWVGHVLTVIAVERDADGNVIGFAYIEGHTKGNKEVGYTKLKDVKQWAGKFLGTVELEGENTQPPSTDGASKKTGN